MIVKKCPKCNQERPINDFYLNKNRNDGHDQYCKNCRSTIYHSHRKKNLEKSRLAHRLYHYSINIEEFFCLLEKQNFKCAICGKAISADDQSTHIDHDHESGGIRGILCRNCNIALGHLEANGLIEWAEKAIRYLINSGARDISTNKKDES